jgi:iron complex outermembrane receptor protein
MAESLPLHPGLMQIARFVAAALLLTIASPTTGVAQTKISDLTQMSIEDLMKIEIVSASRKEQRVVDIPAAVFVITNEDIRRSGMTTIPDLLRLAPGVEVAQINSNKWAVSMRGFNGWDANKLLVLVDGRSVYNRLFSGVLWDAEDLIVDDIDRIEVIRGPGGAIWGVNAVNGVINIVTKPAADTQGGLTRLDIGRVGEQGVVRYGGTLGAASYRLYSQWTRRDQSLIAPDTRADDTSYSVRSGFRADWTAQPGSFMLQGDLVLGQLRALFFNLNPLTAAREALANDPSDIQGGHLLGRWTRGRANGASLQIQSFVDIASRQEPAGIYHRHAVDVDTQYHMPIGAHQDLVAGTGYRFIDETLVGRVGFSLSPAEDHSSLATAFLQDEIVLLGKRLAVTLGSQVQYDSLSGAGIQPTARVMWKGLPRQRLWAATSRALGTPSLLDRGMRVDVPPAPSGGGLPLAVTVLGNPAAETETLAEVEAGYRLEIGTTASFDIAGFVGRYDHLRTLEPVALIAQSSPSPHVLVTSQFGNQLKATTRGLEVVGHWAATQVWRLDGSYTAFQIAPHLAAASQDPGASQEDGSAPRTKWQFRSMLSPSKRATLDVSFFHVGKLEQFQVNAYTRADVRAAWRFTSRLSAMAIGQNVFDAAHAEFVDPRALLLATEIPRSASLRLQWTF